MFTSGDLAKIPSFGWLLRARNGTVRFVEATVTNTDHAEAGYRISETLRSMHSQDGAVLLDLRQGRMFSVNPVGSRILALMKDRTSKSEIVNVLTQEFEVSRATAEKDLREFLAVLAQHKLIEASANCLGVI